MAKYKSKIASLGDVKRNEDLIDSGATHHFFFAKSSFLTYESMKPEAFLAAHGESMIVGSGTVNVNIGNGIMLKVYHAPAFSSNILASHLLSESFNVFITSDGGNKRCEILKKETRDHIIEYILCIDGLYPLKTTSSRQVYNVQKNNRSEEY